MINSEMIENVREIIYNKLWLVLNLLVLITQFYYNFLIKKNLPMIYRIGEDIFDETLEGIKDKNINEYNYKDKISFMIYRLNRSTKYGLDELKYMKHIPLEYTFSMRIVLFSLFLYEYSQLNPPLFIFCLILFLILYQSIKKRCEEFTKDIDKMIWHLKDHQKTMEEHLLNEEKKLDALKANKT